MKFMNTDVAISEKRNTVPQCIQLSDNVKLTSWGSIYINLVKAHLFPSSCCIESDDTVIYIDPVLVDATKKADYIFITHSHFDHFSIKDIEDLSNKNTLIICPKKVAKKLKNHNIKEIKPGLRIELKNISCLVTHAYSTGFPSHPKFIQNVGYIISIGGINIYHAGDTFLVPEIENLRGIDVALVPIDGGNLTMKTEDAASLVNQLKPKIAIPMHYTPDENKANEFKGLINSDIDVIIIAE